MGKRLLIVKDFLCKLLQQRSLNIIRIRIPQINNKMDRKNKKYRKNNNQKNPNNPKKKKL